MLVNETEWPAMIAGHRSYGKCRFNADEASMAAIGKLLSGLRNIVGVRMLPYHLARSKYETVGHTDTMPHVDSPTHEQMDAAAACLRKFGLEVK